MNHVPMATKKDRNEQAHTRLMSVGFVLFFVGVILTVVIDSGTVLKATGLAFVVASAIVFALAMKANKK